MLGDACWFIPRFTAQRDPTLLSYLGLQGEENREKLANAFLRPTTFRDYCSEVSPSRCLDEDYDSVNGTARRPPKDKSEYDRMYIQGVYKGHFRKTADNNCTEFPETCTGHISDYRCGWSSAAEQNLYHLGIGLKSTGKEPGSNGYKYSQLTEIWAAANETKSNEMMRWWTPEALSHTFMGTDAEFQKVSLPLPTQECVKHRVSAQDRCSSDWQVRVGDPRGACGHRMHNVGRVLSTTIQPLSNNPNQPEALWSPAYDVLKTFTVSELQIGEIFQFWLKTGGDQLGSDPREAVCSWLVENLELVESMIPLTYPRTIQEDENL